MIIDLHGYYVKEAKIKFINSYNLAFKIGDKEFIAITGKGTNGTGGKIKKELLKFIEDNKNACQIIPSSNLGEIKLEIIAPINQFSSIIEEEIINYLGENGKTISKIEGNFIKKYTHKEIKIVINKMLKKDLIVKSLKGKHEIYRENK